MITAGGYIRLRREAAGLSIVDVATLISETRRWKRFNIAIIDLIEADQHFPTVGFVDRLRTAFAFDRYVYRQLLCHLRPLPEICQICGCTALDACDDEILGRCAWSDAAHTLCSSPTCTAAAALALSPVRRTA